MVSGAPGGRRTSVETTDVIALELDNITKRYGPTVVLRNVSVTAAAGEVHAIIGENGAGKSTLLKILAGVVAPTSGTMTLQGAPVPFERLGTPPVHSASVCPWSIRNSLCCPR